MQLPLYLLIRFYFLSMGTCNLEALWMSFLVWWCHIHDRSTLLDCKQCGAHMWAWLSGARSHSPNKSDRDRMPAGRQDVRMSTSYRMSTSIFCPWSKQASDNSVEWDLL